MPAGHRPAPPTDTVHVAINGTNFGLPWTNVLWLNITNSGARQQADIDSVCSSFATAWGLRMGAVMGSNAAGNTTTMEWITGPGTALVAVATHGDVVSGNASLNDAAACSVIDWVTGEMYRGGHPRTYLAAPQSSHVTNGQSLDTTLRSSLLAGAQGLITDVNALTHGNITGVKLGTVRFASGNAWLTPPVFKNYTNAKIRPILGTQRRRLGGR